MNDWDRIRQEQKYKQKLLNTKSTLPKITFSNNSSAKKKKLESMAKNLNLFLPQNKNSNRQNQIQNEKPNQFQKQNQLKHTLNEFGLSQYLRKIYELGYDDNNYLKIGLLSRREFEDFVRNIHLYPGQMVKMESFYIYLKQINLNKQNYLSNNYVNKPKSSRGIKRVANQSNINFNNLNRPNTTNIIFNNKNKSVNSQRNYNIYNTNNNKIVNSFANGDFGINYYLNDNNTIKTNSHFYNNSEGNHNNNYVNKFNTQFYENMKLKNINTNLNNNNIKNEEEIEEKMSNDIDNMLKYYMVQLNEKLDDSYHSIEDSTLSHINITSSLNNIDLSKFENLNNKKISSNNTNNSSNTTTTNNTNTFMGKKSIPNKLPIIKKNIDNNNSNEKDHNNNNNNNNDLIIKNKENKRQKIELKPIEKKDSKTIKNEEEKETIKKEEEKQYPKIKIKEKEEKKEEKEEKEEIPKEEKLIEKTLEKEEEIIEEKIDEKLENPQNNNISNNNNINNNKNNTSNNNNEENQNEINKEINYEDEYEIEENIDKKNIQTSQPRYALSENYPKEIQNNNIKTEERYTKEQQIYDNIRLIKSSEGDYIHQNMEQFDIEYMCRCLGLAIMKHLENGKGKQHISDLMNNNESFSFFNSLYNSNMEFLFNFFDKNKNFEEEISNLDKLENKLNENKNNENLFKDDKPISYVHHFKNKIDDEFIKESNNKKLHGIQEIEKDIKFIDEFFSVGRKQIKNYQNISEKSKNVLIKDLSYIGEVDSELITSRINASNINNKSKIEENKNEESKNEDNNNEKNQNDESKYDDYEFMDDEEIDDKIHKRLQDPDEKNEKDDKDNQTIENNENNEKKEENNNNKSEEKENNNNDKIEEKENNENKSEEKENNNNNKIEDNEIKEEENKNDGIKEEENNNEEKQEEKEENKKKEEKDELNEEETNNKEEKDAFNEEEKKEENKNNEEKEEFNEEEIKEENKNNEEKISEKKLENPNEKIEEKYSCITNIKETNNKNDQIIEEIENPLLEKEKFESGTMESDYIIDATTIEKLKSYLIKQIEIFDDDYNYTSEHIPTRKYVPPPDPQTIFEFCANIMILTKMEKEVIIISLIYLERFIFNTGLLLTSRNWRRLSFIIMVIASKIWDDDSFENNHFAQVFTHLKIGEINLMERTFLELINYKTYIKCSEYFKYFFIIKSIALKYNYNGNMLVPISVEKMMKIQEYAYIMQKKMKKKYSLNNSAQF